MVGLTATHDGSAVTGVRLRRRGADADPMGREELAADLVVDAGGRVSRAPEWLVALGYPVVAETTIDAFLGYASRLYAPPSDWSADWKLLMIQAKAPTNGRSAFLFPVEGGRWHVSMMGTGKDYPPTDEAGFLAFARGLRSPLLAEAIARAEPLSPVFGHRSTANRMRHFERLPRRPERFLVVGDAACAFNPVYGQGMTVAAKTALALDRSLRQQRARHGADLTGFAARFQQEVAETAEAAWLIATGEDLRFPTTEGATPGPQTRLMHRYLDRVIAAATQDAAVNRAFLDVLNLNAPPASLFRPATLARVLLRGRTVPGADPYPATAALGSAAGSTG